MLVLGVNISAGEYRQRTAAETFLITPRRWRVIAAKLAVAAAVGAVFGALSAGVAMAVADGVYRIKDDEFPLDSSGAWLTLAGAVLYAALFGAIGAATGSLVRNQVAAIAGWLVWLSLVEHVVGQLMPSLGRWFPSGAGRALVRAPNDDLLSGVAIVGERYRDA